MKNVEDIYPLSPMQAFMLFHSVSRRRRDVLFDQFCFAVNHAVDASAFEAAWQALLDRHAILRTAFVWEAVKQPLQVVRTAVRVPFERLDWSNECAGTWGRKLEALREADRRQGFDPRRAPLLRVKLVRLREDAYFGLWSSHHLLLDRWCLSPLIAELQHLYGALARGQRPTLPAPAPFREYIRWIQRQDRDAAEAYWAQRLAWAGPAASLTAPVADDAREGGAAAARQAWASFDAATVSALRGLARACGATLGSAVQAAWALVLNRVLEEPAPVFGLTVAGRPSDLAGIEGMLGSFVNNVPVRLSLRGDATVRELLRGLQAEQQTAQAFDYLAPAELARLASLPPERVLFDHLLVWLAPETARRDGDLAMDFLPGTLHTAYPLTVGIAESSESLTITWRVADGHRCRVPPSRLADALRELVAQLIAAGPHARLSTLPGFFDALPAPAAIVPSRHRGGRAVASGTAARAGRVSGDQAMIEDMLVAHFSEVLGQPIADRGASVFDLGATSLSAAAVHARVQTGLRREVPLLAMFDDPSIRGMARALIRAEWPLKDGMRFPLRESGSRPPLFCIASPEVDTLGFVLLTRHLPPDQPVHLVQAPPDADDVRRITPLELPVLCAGYVDALREVQPRGPYQLIGTCTGAQMAVEIARQLAAVDSPTGFLGIIHTWGFYTVSRRRHLYAVANRARYLSSRLRQVLAARAPRWRPAVPAVCLEAARSTSGRPAQRGAHAAPAHHADDARSTRLWLEDFGWPGNDPGLAKLDGPLVLFRNRHTGAQRFWRVRDPLMGWGRQAADVRVEHLPAREELDILREPHVRALAAAVERHLCTTSIANEA